MVATLGPVDLRLPLPLLLLLLLPLLLPHQSSRASDVRSPIQVSRLSPQHRQHLPDASLLRPRCLQAKNNA